MLRKTIAISLLSAISSTSLVIGLTLAVHAETICHTGKTGTVCVDIPEVGPIMSTYTPKKRAPKPSKTKGSDKVTDPCPDGVITHRTHWQFIVPAGE